ncbi:hypothetical protein OAP56_03410 [Rickettsiaceae bacterium]|nr:hypothetical protein [Rickettsiaceae bacterium]
MTGIEEDQAILEKSKVTLQEEKAAYKSNFNELNKTSISIKKEIASNNLLQRNFKKESLRLKELGIADLKRIEKEIDDNNINIISKQTEIQGYSKVLEGELKKINVGNEKIKEGEGDLKKLKINQLEAENRAIKIAKKITQESSDNIERRDGKTAKNNYKALFAKLMKKKNKLEQVDGEAVQNNDQADFNKFMKEKDELDKSINGLEGQLFSLRESNEAYSNYALEIKKEKEQSETLLKSYKKDIPNLIAKKTNKIKLIEKHNIEQQQSLDKIKQTITNSDFSEKTNKNNAAIREAKNSISLVEKNIYDLDQKIAINKFLIDIHNNVDVEKNLEDLVTKNLLVRSSRDAESKIAYFRRNGKEKEIEDFQEFAKYISQGPEKAKEYKESAEYIDTQVSKYKDKGENTKGVKEVMNYAMSKYQALPSWNRGNNKGIVEGTMARKSETDRLFKSLESSRGDKTAEVAENQGYLDILASITLEKTKEKQVIGNDVGYVDTKISEYELNDKKTVPIKAVVSKMEKLLPYCLGNDNKLRTTSDFIKEAEVQFKGQGDYAQEKKYAKALMGIIRESESKSPKGIRLMLHKVKENLGLGVKGDIEKVKGEDKAQLKEIRESIRRNREQKGENSKGLMDTLQKIKANKNNSRGGG